MNRSIAMRFLIAALIIPLTATLLSLGGCEGSEGEQGPQGPEGPAGPAGPAGDDGSMIYSGNGAPANSLGSEGDYYLDQVTASLYGPKTATGWDTPINLQGPSGEDGSEILSGTGSPTTSIGMEGDYYLDKDTYDFYGPKSSSGWGTPINLKGTANVIYSGWFEAGSYTDGGTPSAYVEKPAPAISQEIIDDGVILAYCKLIGDNEFVRPLPATTYNVNEAIWNYLIPGEGSIRFTVKTIDDSNISPAGSNQYRYVLIPGGVSLNKKSHLEELPYEKIKKRFGLRN